MTRKWVRSSLEECLQPLFIRLEDVNTTQGLRLHGEDAEKAIPEIDEDLRRKTEENLRKEAKAEEKYQAKRKVRCKERLVFEKWAMLRRERLYVDEPVMPCLPQVMTAAANVELGSVKETIVVLIEVTIWRPVLIGPMEQ